MDFDKLNSLHEKIIFDGLQINESNILIIDSSYYYDFRHIALNS